MKTNAKICISRMDKMGDMILSLPAIQAIKIANPNTEISILASKNNQELLKNIDYIDNYIFVNTEVSLIDFFKNLFFLRKKKYDLFLNFSPTFLSYFYCFFSKSDKKGVLIFLSRYKKKLFSKINYRLLSKIFCNHILIVNRYLLLKNNQEIHQTKIIFKLLKLCNVNFNKDTKIKIVLPKEKLNITNNKKKLITFHLSNKWINQYYSEESFFELIAKLPTKKINYALTTDKDTKLKFKKIYKKFNILNNDKFDDLNILSNDFTIFDKLKFENWKKIIFSSDLIITPECGCSHMAAACKTPVIIIYDADNLPEAISKEYYPWKSKYKKLISNDRNLNKKIIEGLT